MRFLTTTGLLVTILAFGGCGSGEEPAPPAASEPGAQAQQAAQAARAAAEQAAQAARGAAEQAGEQARGAAEAAAGAAADAAGKAADAARVAAGAVAGQVASAGKPGDAAKGEALYQTYCSSCHGPRGEGDGPVAAGLNPKPAKHNDGAYMNQLSNEHLFKVVKLGGPAVGKSPLMAPWGGTLSDEQIWDVVAFVRSLAEPPYPGES